MSNDFSYTEITKAMETPLQEVRNYPFLARERTFFSVEGIIGRYENPTSDLPRS